MKLFCFGFGQVAQYFVDHLLSCNVDLKLITTSRNTTSELTFKNLKYFNYEFNENDFDKDLINPLQESNHILISVPPINGKDMFIERLVKNNLNLQNLKWLTYLSSTSVYGNHDGAWVNEDSTTNPQTLAGKNRLNVEKDWLSIGTKNS